MVTDENFESARRSTNPSGTSSSQIEQPQSEELSIDELSVDEFLIDELSHDESTDGESTVRSWRYQRRKIQLSQFYLEIKITLKTLQKWAFQKKNLKYF